MSAWGSHCVRLGWLWATGLRQRDLFDPDTVWSVVAIACPVGRDSDVDDLRPRSSFPPVGLLLVVRGHVRIVCWLGYLLAMPSSCTVCSSSQPIMSATRPSRVRLAYFREEVTVSNTISPASVAAIPTSQLGSCPRRDSGADRSYAVSRLDLRQSVRAAGERTSHRYESGFPLADPLCG